MKILLTGFEPFGKVLDNPSQRVVEHFAAKGLASEQKAKLITAVLPVDYVAASAILEELLESHKPDAVLMLGVAQMRESINLERIAINVNDAKIADNAGNLKSGQAIVDDAPVAYRSTLPLEAMYQAIQDAGISVVYSNHAGAYLCNHVFYFARHWLECAGLGHIPCGFIHLPDMGEEAPKMPLVEMIRAIELALGVLYKKESWLDILKHFEQRLPVKPDWVVLLTEDGRTVGEDVDTPGEERDPSAIVMAQLSVAEHVTSKSNLGHFEFSLVSANKGFLLTIPIHDDFLLGMKFSKELEISSLGILGDGMFAALEELSFKLKDR